MWKSVSGRNDSSEIGTAPSASSSPNVFGIGQEDRSPHHVGERVQVAVDRLKAEVRHPDGIRVRVDEGEGDLPSPVLADGAPLLGRRPWYFFFSLQDIGLVYHARDTHPRPSRVTQPLRRRAAGAAPRARRSRSGAPRPPRPSRPCTPPASPRRARPCPWHARRHRARAARGRRAVRAPPAPPRSGRGTRPAPWQSTRKVSRHRRLRPDQEVRSSGPMSPGTITAGPGTPRVAPFRCTVRRRTTPSTTCSSTFAMLCATS